MATSLLRIHRVVRTVSDSSSRRNEHGFHLIFSLIIALLGFILLLALNNRGGT